MTEKPLCLDKVSIYLKTLWPTRPSRVRTIRHYFLNLAFCRKLSDCSCVPVLLQVWVIKSFFLSESLSSCDPVPIQTQSWGFWAWKSWQCCSLTQTLTGIITNSNNLRCLDSSVKIKPVHHSDGLWKPCSWFLFSFMILTHYGDPRKTCTSGARTWLNCAHTFPTVFETFLGPAENCQTTHHTLPHTHKYTNCLAGACSCEFADRQLVSLLH